MKLPNVTDPRTLHGWGCLGAFGEPREPKPVHLALIYLHVKCKLGKEDGRVWSDGNLVDLRGHTKVSQGINVCVVLCVEFGVSFRFGQTEMYEKCAPTGILDLFSVT